MNGQDHIHEIFASALLGISFLIVTSLPSNSKTPFAPCLREIMQRKQKSFAVFWVWKAQLRRERERIQDLMNSCEVYLLLDSKKKLTRLGKGSKIEVGEGQCLYCVHGLSLEKREKRHEKWSAVYGIHYIPGVESLHRAIFSVKLSIWCIGDTFFENFISAKGRVWEGGEEVTERSIFHPLVPQIAKMASTGLGRSQEQGTSSRSHTWVSGPKHLGDLLLLFLGH